MTINNRQFPRQEIQIEVELEYLEDTTRKAITRDVSEGGLFIRLNDADHYPMGEMVLMRFKHPLEDFQDTVKDGVVVRQAADGIGVAFIEMEEF